MNIGDCYVEEFVGLLLISLLTSTISIAAKKEKKDKKYYKAE